MWLSESRRRARFRGAQATYDRRGDPMWDGPDPEPESEDIEADTEKDGLRSEPCATE